MFKVPENFRVRQGAFATDAKSGCNGMFVIPSGGFRS